VIPESFNGHYHDSRPYPVPERDPSCDFHNGDGGRIVHVLAPSQGTVVSKSPRGDRLEEQRGNEREGDDVRERQPRSLPSSGPPVSEVRIPLETVVRQGLIELSTEDWKGLYLSTSRNLEHAHLHLRRTSEENRKLKRQLIEMQKCLFETRRNKRQLLHSVPDHLYPWSIPDSRRHAFQRAPSQLKGCHGPSQHPPRQELYRHQLQDEARSSSSPALTIVAAPLVVTSTHSEEDASTEQQPLQPLSPRLRELRHLHLHHQHLRPRPRLVDLRYHRPRKVQRRDDSTSTTSAATTGGTPPAAS
jgi:hypothetical protein